MAIINVDDAYILNETGAQVDKTTGIPFKNESLTEAEAAQARANIRAGGSNRNLLDNWYFVGGGSQLGDGVFPINQRGLTFYASQSTGIDRWKSDSPWGDIANIALQADGLVIAGNTEPSYPTSFVRLSQVLATPPVGKTVTLSILTDIVSPDSEGNYPHIWCGGSVAQAITSPGLTSVTFTWPSTENSVCIVVDNGATSAASLRMQAIKLEVGSVSTIQNDAPPDFGDELRKCQRYLYVLNAPAYHFLGEVALAGDATNCTIGFHLPAEMRTTAPSVTLTSGLWVGGAQTTAVNWTRTIGTTVIAACTVTGGLSGSTLYAVATGASDTTITISAEP